MQKRRRREKPMFNIAAVNVYAGNLAEIVDSSRARSPCLGGPWYIDRREITVGIDEFMISDAAWPASDIKTCDLTKVVDAGSDGVEGAGHVYGGEPPVLFRKPILVTALAIGPN